MIKQLSISNFRCYINTTIHFNGTSIVVGKNNAGKSTMIEALKIISSVTRKYKTARFVFAPDWVNKSTYGISPNVENMNISDRGIFHMYGAAPAVIEAVFSNGTSIIAYVGDGLDVFAIIYDSDGCPIINSKQAKNVDIPLIEVLPQISPVLDNEKIINKKTVDGNRATRLASRNFRNQLFYYEEAFPIFKRLVESTWESLRVSPIESYYEGDGRILQLFVRVNNFEAEIGWMGHGLQMWIQTMWFISQCPNNAIVVLDEPDVYMHADLQRRLIRLITPMFPQLIIATHSLEIIEEVTSDCIIPIDAQKNEIWSIGNEISLLPLSKQLGSPLNIDLARIFISNKFIIWNTDDVSRKVLSAFQSVLLPQDLHPLVNFPKAFINGWYEWDKMAMLAELFATNKMMLELFCIMNPDFHTKSEIIEYKNKANKNGIKVHVWNKTEIENYAINANAIFRYISNNRQKGIVTENIVNDTIQNIAEDMIDNIIKFSIDNSPKALTKAEKEELYKRYEIPFDTLSGRDFFNILSSWTQKEYGISISARQVIPYFKVNEIPTEVSNVIMKLIGYDPS